MLEDDLFHCTVSNRSTHPKEVIKSGLKQNEACLIGINKSQKNSF